MTTGVDVAALHATFGEFMGIHTEALPAWVYSALPHIIIGLFVFAFGACLGSFVNVLVHRLPAGISVVSPPSRCPRCGVLLGWRENLPVVGWLLLRGRCRTCRGPISIQYPGVEALVGALCTLLYIAYFTTGALTPWWNEIGGAWFPAAGPLRAMPIFALHCLLIAALVAMTLIDARLSIVTLEIPVTVTLIAFVAWPIQGWLALGGRRVDELPLPLPDWPWLMAGMGAIIGVVIANILARRGTIPQSDDAFEIDLDAPLSPLIWMLLLSPVAIGLGVGGLATGSTALMLAGAAVLVVSLVWTVAATRRQAAQLEARAAIRSATRGSGPEAAGGRGGADVDRTGAAEPRIVHDSASISGVDQEMMPPRDYPAALRLVGGELLFLLPILLCAVVGLWLGQAIGERLGTAPPLPLACLGGSVLGYLAGGGVIWAIRLAGTAGFGREAMGLGDVHLLGAVGAVLGWIDPLAGMMLATASGIVWAMLTGVILRRWGGLGSAMPFGPHLAVGCMLVIALRPALADFWAALTASGTFSP